MHPRHFFPSKAWNCMPTKRSDLTTNLVASLVLHTKRINGETVASPHYFLPAYVSVPKVQEEDKPRKMSQILTVWSDMLEKKCRNSRTT